MSVNGMKQELSRGLVNRNRKQEREQEGEVRPLAIKFPLRDQKIIHFNKSNVRR